MKLKSIDTIARWAIAALLVTLAAIEWQTARYYQMAWEVKTTDPKIIFRGQGQLTFNPSVPYHIIIGYDVHNCTISGPSDNNVIANGSFVLDGQGPIIDFSGATNSTVTTIGVSKPHPQD